MLIVKKRKALQTPHEFLVSVVVPVYNAARYVKTAVESAVQLPEAGEVIIVEDASADDSLSVCRELEEKYSKVKLVRHAGGNNRGVAASRNAGILQARFEYIAFLDADDWYLPSRFKKDREIFLANPEVDGVYGCNKASFEKEDLPEHFVRHYSRTTVQGVVPPQELYRILLFSANERFHTSTITVRRRVFQRVGLFNTALQQGEDTELWLKLSLRAKLVAGSIDEPIAIRRVHNNNSIHQKEKADYYHRKMYQELFDWAVQQSLPFDVKNCFFITLNQYGKSGLYSARELFWMQTFRKPSIMLSAFFYKKVHQLYFT